MSLNMNNRKQKLLMAAAAAVFMLGSDFALAQRGDGARAYREGTLGIPSPFFPAPPRPEVKLRPVGDGPVGTQVVDLAFKSGYVPYLKIARDASAKYPR